MVKYLALNVRPSRPSRRHPLRDNHEVILIRNVRKSGQFIALTASFIWNVIDPHVATVTMEPV